MDTDRELEETLRRPLLSLRSYGGQGGFTREKVRVVARKSAKFHESSHRSGPWLRDVTHCYGWDLFLTTDGHE